MNRRFGRVAVIAAGMIVGVGPTVATATQHGGPETATWLEGGVGAAIVGALITLVVGGAVLVLGRSYAERVTGKARSEPGRSFLVGIASLLIVLGLVVLGVATRILLIVAVPVLIVFVIMSIFGAVMGELAVGRTIVDDWAEALVVAVVVAAFTAGVPVLGALVGFVVASIGIGAVINHARDGDGKRTFNEAPAAPSSLNR